MNKDGCPLRNVSDSIYFMTMNSRERFLSVLGGDVPDRVPVTLFIQDSGHFLNQVCPTLFFKPSSPMRTLKNLSAVMMQPPRFFF